MVHLDIRRPAPPSPAPGPRATGSPPTAPPAAFALPEAPWLDVAVALAIAAVALWVDLPAALHGGLDYLDEGFEYQLASRILHGQIPYRDFFTVVTPLAFYWQALLIAVFGPSLAVGRVSVAAAGAAIAVGIYLAGGRLAGRPLAVAAALASIPWGIPYWAQPNYSWYVNVLAVFTAWTALRAGARRGGWVAPGLLAAATVLTKQNVGLGTAGAVLVYAAWRGGWPGLRTYALALAAPLAAWIAYMAANGALGALWYQTVGFAIHSFPHAARIRYPALRQDLRTALRPGRGGAQALVSYLPHAVLAAGLPVLAGGALLRRPWVPEGVLAWMLVLAGLSIAYPRADFVHIDYALPLAFLGFAWLLRRGFAGRAELVPVAVLPLLALAGALGPWHPGRVHRGGSLGVPYTSGMENGTDAGLRAVVTAVDNTVPPGQPVLILPWAAMLYYLADRPNPTPYDLDITLNMPPGGNAQIARVMAATHCPVFLQPGAGISGSFLVYGAPVIAELHRDYRLTGQAGAFQIWLWAGQSSP